MLPLVAFPVAFDVVVYCVVVAWAECASFGAFLASLDLALLGDVFGCLASLGGDELVDLFVGVFDWFA